MEELEAFSERPADPQVSVSISEATFAWDKVHTCSHSQVNVHC